MSVATEQEPLTAGELIRFWRTRRRLSQLELALEAHVSTKHLSFVETGRSRPSRQLLVHLAQELDLPIGERNRLLLAGGFAPPYQERPYDGEFMRPLRESLRRLLDAHEPNPALMVDGLWNLFDANSAASLLWEGVDPALLEPPVNILRLGVHPGGLPAISSMIAACSAPLVHRLRRKARDDADEALGALLDEIEAYLPQDPPKGVATERVVSLDLHTRLGDVRLFTIIATLGAPLEVTAANLAIETFLPADEESAARLRDLANPRVPLPGPALGGTGALRSAVAELLTGPERTVGIAVPGSAARFSIGRPAGIFSRVRSPADRGTAGASRRPARRDAG